MIVLYTYYLQFINTMYNFSDAGVRYSSNYPTEFHHEVGGDYDRVYREGEGRDGWVSRSGPVPLYRRRAYEAPARLMSCK